MTKKVEVEELDDLLIRIKGELTKITNQTDCVLGMHDKELKNGAIGTIHKNLCDVTFVMMELLEYKIKAVVDRETPSSMSEDNTCALVHQCDAGDYWRCDKCDVTVFWGCDKPNHVNISISITNGIKIGKWTLKLRRNFRVSKHDGVALLRIQHTGFANVFFLVAFLFFAY